jgi:hypothetical protein
MRVSASIRSGINLNMSDISTEALSGEVETDSRQENASKQETGAALRFDPNGKGSRHLRKLPQAIGNDRMTAPDGAPSPSGALIARLMLRGFVEEALC